MYTCYLCVSAGGDCHGAHVTVWCGGRCTYMLYVCVCECRWCMPWCTSGCLGLCVCVQVVYSMVHVVHMRLFEGFLRLKPNYSDCADSAITH